ncbi:hypothetical protein WJX81_001911 [Elliptochloris bilobata]|uniref:tRNA-dihydrouridine(16/17) synthase [NAD(P)(+)] n=1 Tax=Elliptochloris bilobata TaxID=381761 RepID=A0AAW1R1P6_9CHLO
MAAPPLAAACTQAPAGGDFPLPDRPAVPHAEAAWAAFRAWGSPRFHVAPMVDASELPFRLLCRRYGAAAAYTPMLHSRLFLEDERYRAEHFTTCEADRPLFVQFCANDPDTLLAAARVAEPHCDAIDLNLGCPQHIARRGRYGAYLMDELPLVERLVRTLASGLRVPVSVKIRIFPELAHTLAYAHMLEAAGASIVAVHGRTRDQKKSHTVRADWDAIRAVKRALSVPVLANGNVRTLADAEACLAYTGCDGVLSAESLLADPALFWRRRGEPGGAWVPLDAPALLLEYLDLVDRHPVPNRMVRAHAFKILGAWLAEHVDLRNELHRGRADPASVRTLALTLRERIAASGRAAPVPVLTERARLRLEAEAARADAIAEQEREGLLLARLQAKRAAGAIAAAPPVGAGGLLETEAGLVAVQS